MTPLPLFSIFHVFHLFLHFPIFSFLVVFEKFVSFFSEKSRFQHLFLGYTKDVSSVVGAPWRCGVLTTQGGIAGFGLGHLLGRELDSTPQSGGRLLAC